MRRKLLDILAFPIYKHYPLRLLEFSTKETLASGKPVNLS